MFALKRKQKKIIIIDSLSRIQNIIPSIVDKHQRKTHIIKIVIILTFMRMIFINELLKVGKYN